MDYKKILEGVVDIINTTEKSDIGFANICSYIGENFHKLEKSKDTYIYVVTRCEEHSDYVEEVFYDEKKAQEYCDKFNSNENNYSRQITKIKPNI